MWELAVCNGRRVIKILQLLLLHRVNFCSQPDNTSLHKLEQVKWLGPDNLRALTIQPSHKTKALNVLLIAPQGDKRPERGIVSVRARADGQMTPFYHLMSQPPLSSPDQSFKSVKVSKFNARLAYMWLTCAQGEHLHVLELQRGVGWVQSLAVVCHVHVYQWFEQTNSTWQQDRKTCPRN